MAESFTCSCGYVGPSVAEGSKAVCPICRTPVMEARWSQPASAPEDAAGNLPGIETGFPNPGQFNEPSLLTRKTFRIPCPNGHVNVSPAHMLGTQVVCPKCNAFYVLQMADSIEYQQIAEREARKREEEQAKKWLARAIYAAIFIVVSLIGMIAISVAYR